MLRYDAVCLEGFGYALPETVVSSAELERELSEVYERFGLHEGRLELMTGIRERRFWDEGDLPSDGATEAGRQALAATGTSPEEIECLINGSVSRDFLEPATASVVHDNLRLPRQSIMFDISNACLGFLNGMISLANMIELGQVKKGLIVAGESSRALVDTTIEQLRRATKLTRGDLKRAFASLTIGSGAVALVMAHRSVAKLGARLLGGVVRTAAEHNNLCRGSEDTGFGAGASMSMNTDAETLLEQGCALAAETWRSFQHALGWTKETVSRAFCHQVGLAHRDRFYDSIGLDVSRDYVTFDVLGNVGSVSLPITMALGLERQPPSRGERIAMLGIGSGLSCIMLGVEWS
jgi:3-oxoacyl-[acyl-carrier-protein] synthase-3